MSQTASPADRGDEGDVSMGGEPGIPFVLSVLIGGLGGVVLAWWVFS